MDLPLELRSKLFNGASTLDEYKKIRLASNLTDSELKLLIEQEYNSKLKEAQDNIVKSRKVHSKLPLIAQLYFLRNPIKKYTLLEYDNNESEVYFLITGSKSEILNMIKFQVRKRLVEQNLYQDDNEKIDIDKEVDKAMIEYTKEVNEQIDAINLGYNSTHLINQNEMFQFDYNNSIYYIITKC